MGKASGSLDRRICQCGKLTRNNGRDRAGNTRWGVLCSGCHDTYKYDKKSYCEANGCTSTIVHGVQLEIDHIDGNKRNNNLDNLQTLCCNCHRLKTHANNEWTNRYAI
jgi:hypothetical protein